MSNKFFIVGMLVILVEGIATGNLYASDLDIKLRGSLNQTYDDNIFYEKSDPKKDYISSLSAGMSLNYEGKRTEAGLSLDVAQNIFWKYTENQNTTERVTAKLKQELSKFDSITISNTFAHTYEPYSFEDQFVRVSGRYSYYRNVFDIGYQKDYTEQFSAKFGYGNELDLTSRSDLPDSYVNRLSFEGDYAFSSENIVLGAYEFLHRKLDPGGNANTHTLSTGMRHLFTEQLSLEGRVGADFIDSYSGKTYVNPLWSAVLTDEISEKQSANLSYIQGYSTNPSTEDIFNSWRVSGGVNRDLFKRLSGAASVFYGRGKYVTLDIKDNLFGGYTALSYDINKNLRGDLSYTYSQTTSNVDTREYRKNVVSLGISGDF